MLLEKGREGWVGKRIKVWMAWLYATVVAAALHASAVAVTRRGRGGGVIGPYMLQQRAQPLQHSPSP